MTHRYQLWLINTAPLAVELPYVPCSSLLTHLPSRRTLSDLTTLHNRRRGFLGYCLRFISQSVCFGIQRVRWAAGQVLRLREVLTSLLSTKIFTLVYVLTTGGTSR